MKIDTSIRACELPDRALLGKYREAKAYTDCYTTEIAGTISQPEFVEAFYTTAIFKVEQLILAWFLSRPSTDAQARQLAEGDIDAFAAWRVEDREAGQLLLGDFSGRTKSWLMAVPLAGKDGDRRTQLYFGSAVVPRVNARTGAREMGGVFRALLGFHKLYSRVLLGAARKRVLALQRIQVMRGPAPTPEPRTRRPRRQSR